MNGSSASWSSEHMLHLHTHPFVHLSTSAPCMSPPLRGRSHAHPHALKHARTSRCGNRWLKLIAICCQSTDIRRGQLSAKLMMIRQAKLRLETPIHLSAACMRAPEPAQLLPSSSLSKLSSNSSALHRNASPGEFCQ